MIGIIVLAFNGLLLFILGWLIDKKEMHGLISGYNTMKKERKEQVDIKGLAGFLAKNLYLMGILLCIAGIGIWMDLEYVTLISIALIFPQTIYLVIKAQSFDPGSRNEDGSYKMSVKLIIGLMVIVFAGVSMLLFSGLHPSEIVIEEESFTIKGFYGKTIEYETIINLSLEEERPDIIRRNNGSSIADMRKGRFTLEDNRPVILFLEPDQPPYIMIQTENDRFLISREPREETELLYEMINDKTQKGSMNLE